MNQFFERLPWRVAALAGLLVGGISLAVGIDPWNCLLRVGAAFIVFGAAGLGLRAILIQDSHSLPQSGASSGRGRHFDQTTPDDPLGDHALDSSESSSSTGSGDSP